MSSTLLIQAFLPGRSFVIPIFQRDYAWTREEVEDLFGDVQEALETNTSHFLGTIVLANTRSPFEIVDGQQRLSTLLLMIHALISQLDPTDPARIADEVYLLKEGGEFKLNFGPNQSFVADLLAGRNVNPVSRGQRRLKEAYQYCCERAQAIHRAQPNGISRWLETVKKLEIIPFFEADRGRAISIFQSVNDRGRQLTDMDKAKALLVFYSNRFLGGALDDRISAAFGECYAAYDRIRELANETGYKIDLINRANFSEDDILRYHYLAFDDPKADDYYGSKVLDLFLKPALKQRQAMTDAIPVLQAFIADYIEDLAAFTKTFASMMEAVRSDRRVYTLLVVHGLSALLYPLAVRLYQRSLLFQTVPDTTPAIDVLHCLAVVDLRIYKIRGTDPARDIGNISHRSRTASVSNIATELRAFLLRFMQDSLMETHLGGRVYRNGGLVPILLASEQYAAGHQYDLDELVERIRQVPTQEHILAQEPSFDSSARGFNDEADFEDHLDRLGNLTLLTSSENSRCHNKSAELKMSQPELYAASQFAGPRMLAHEFNLNGGRFDKSVVLTRTKALTQFALAHWAIW